MHRWETFSKRLKRESQAGQPDPYQYDTLPHGLRVQIALIWRTTIGIFYLPGEWSRSSPSISNEFWLDIHNTVAREHGLFYLGSLDKAMDERCAEYLLNAPTFQALDIIEYSFRVIDLKLRALPVGSSERAGIKQGPDDAIDELNDRFREHAVGYQYTGGIITRLDSQFAHAEIVKPALSLLNDRGFKGPGDEFLQAFDHYRHGRHKEAVADALKALESTAKAICAARQWSHPSNATALPLLKLLFENGLIPAELESHFAGLRSALESGLPTLSNKTSRHGQGPDPVIVPPHFAAFALHLVASDIIFLVQAHRALK
jgi:uncharacterized protein DUF7014/AbiJ-like protein